MTSQHVLALDLLPGRFALCRLGAADAVPDWALAGRRFVTVSRTPQELSIVCDAEVVPAGAAALADYRALRVRGPLALDTVGVIAALAPPLAGAGIPLLPIATHDTDYLFLREADLARGIAALEQAGHRIHPEE
jgi:uncharacterized protein